MSETNPSVRCPRCFLVFAKGDAFRSINAAVTLTKHLQDGHALPFSMIPGLVVAACQNGQEQS